ncbi:hypothetical protein BSKO_04852 [Bryopsis sp. KO-2023]|nr:hypothetical protein BSKO_04852 [Bryopsis sp. KO-2023]
MARLATMTPSMALDDVLEEIKHLPCLRFLMARGPVAIDIFNSRVLKTMTNVESMIAIIDGTFLDPSISCEDGGCPAFSNIALPQSLQSLDIGIREAAPVVRPTTSEVRASLMALPESLKFLSIRGTQFGGELPPQLPPGIQAITLRDNKFTGQVPKEWGDLSELIALLIWEAAMDNRVELDQVGWENLRKFDLRLGNRSTQDLMLNSTVEFRRTMCAASQISSDLATLIAVKPMDCLEFMTESDAELIEWMDKTIASTVLWTISSTLRLPQTACRHLDEEIDSPLGSFPFSQSVDGCPMVADSSECKNCAKILGLHIFDLEEAKNVLEAGVLPLIEKLPCLQTLEIGPEFMQPQSSVPNIEIPAALSTVDKETLCIFGSTVGDFQLPSNVESLAISGGAISNEEEYKSLLKLPGTLKRLRLENSGYGGMLPENLPAIME